VNRHPSSISRSRPPATNYRAVLEALLAHPDCDAVLAVSAPPPVHPNSRCNHRRIAAGASRWPCFSRRTRRPRSSCSRKRACRRFARPRLAPMRSPPISLARTARRKHGSRACLARRPARKRRAGRSAGADPVRRARRAHGALGHRQRTGICPRDRLSCRRQSAVARHPAQDEVGGVALALADRAAFDARVPRMPRRGESRRPRGAHPGVLVQQMAAGLAEVIVGYRHDCADRTGGAGRMGGQLAEIYRDTSVRCARWMKQKRWRC